MIKVLIADDHPVVREGLKQIISKATDMEVGGEALNGQEVLDILDKQKWDVIVLDLNMPGRDGIEVLKEIRREYGKLPVLILSIYPEEQMGVRVLKAGASGFLSKESAPKELLNAIRKIYSGGKYVSPTLAERLAIAVEVQYETDPHKSLSNREYQVLCFIASGKSINEIAEQLSLSDKTIRTYRDRLLEKMHLKNDVELTHYAIKHKLIEPLRD
ncbi:MAG: response regulator transcription factor [Ignavibacteriales bacterium]|nr:response regulator transcription factor [Ignavibacteriales bacterium]